MRTPVQLAPWEEAARRAGISGRALEDSHFAILEQKRGPLLKAIKEAFIAITKELKQPDEATKLRLNISSETKDGFRIFSTQESGSPKRQVWFTLSGKTEILASRRDSLEGDCGTTSYRGSEWNDLELVGNDSQIYGLTEVAELHCRWMLTEMVGVTCSIDIVLGEIDR